MSAPIPAQRDGGHDRLVITDPGHPYTGRAVTVTAAVSTTGYIVRIDGLDITQAAPQYVRNDQIREQS